MPILYLHGVFIRDETGWDDLERMIRRYVAPVISQDPQNVLIERCFWGDFGAQFKWNNLSTPDSPVRHAMLESISMAKESHASMVRFSDLSKRLLEQGTKTKSAGALAAVRLKDLSAENLSDFYARLIASDAKFSAKDRSLAMMAADDVACEPATETLLRNCKKIEDEFTVMQKLMKERYIELQADSFDATAKKSFPAMTKEMAINFFEGVARAAQGAGFAVTRAAAEVRAPINMFVTTFIGDVLTYLYGRGDASKPGQIPLIVLDSLARCRDNQLERPGEPLIVLSHSMGGQIIYDLITHFIPRMPEFADIRIDYWCATASQVGLFEELKLFIESSNEYGMEFGNLVPFPDTRTLGYWWNVWDYNDFLSWSAKGIIDGVDDQFYNTGMFLIDAHGGYLVLPSFFRRFARKLEQAKALNWRREEAAQGSVK